MAKPKQPALEIVYRAVKSLKTDPQNARVHPPAQIAQLIVSIKKYGLTKPVLLKDDDMTVGAGNGVWTAAREMGMKEIPTITIRGLTPEQWRAYAIADNKIAMNSEWNLDVLRTSLESLFTAGHSPTDMGFSPLELGIMGVAGFELDKRLERADETPILSDNPVVALGELWILGKHRLFIGDSTNSESVARVLSGRAADLVPLVTLMITDPPYGVNYDPNWRNEAARTSTGMGNRAIGAGATGKVSNDDRADWSAAWNLYPGDVAYVWHGALHAPLVAESLASAGFVVRSQIIWDKTRMIIGRGDYHWEHEPCWYVVRKGKPGGYVGDRKQTTMWRIGHQKSETGHGTQKPVECMRRPILNNSKVGDAVYDPFCGSGTTLIAAEMEDRRCFAMELDPIYAQVIIERWENYASGTAKREDGKTLAQLKKGKKT